MDRKAWWHRAGRGGLHDLLDLPAPRQPLARDALAEDETYAGSRSRATTPGRCSATTRRGLRGSRGVRWSYRRDLGGTRVIVDGLARRSGARGGAPVDLRRRGVGVDRRAGRGRLRPPADRDDRPLPALPRLPPSRGLERAPSATGPGVRWRRGSCEKLRRGVDFDHWASFGGLLPTALAALPTRSARGRRRAGARLDRRPLRRRPPRLPGRGRAFRPAPESESRVYQAVCSPYRNPLDEERASRDQARVFRNGAAADRRGRSRGRPASRPGIGWRLLEGPYFDNQVATLTLDGRSARIKLEKTAPGEADERALETSFERRLA